MDRIELELYLNNLLEIARFKDYCPNGLQVEGRRRVNKLATGVTASLAFLEAALDWGADAVLVHHGYFWSNEAPQITGRKHARLKLLIANDLNLFAYHLPLDEHPEFGNNAQIGEKMGWISDARFGENDLGWLATLPMPITLAHFTAQVEQTLGRTPLVFGDPDRELRRVGWCTGARARLVRRRDQRRRRRLPERRSVGVDDAHRGGKRCRVPCGRPSCDRTVRRAGGGQASVRAVRYRTPVYRYP